MPTTHTTVIQVDIKVPTGPHGFHDRTHWFELTLAHEKEADGDLDLVGLRERVKAWMDADWGGAFLVENGELAARMLASGQHKVRVMAVKPTRGALARIAFKAAKQLLEETDAVVLHVSCDTGEGKAGYSE